MDITSFIVSTRETSLLDGSYGAYRKRLSKKLLNIRKRLGIATKNRGKYQQKAPITAPAISENSDYVRLHILTSERAWAHAMEMKVVHTANDQLAGSNRSHIISRLDKAASVAEKLVEALSETDITSATATDLLEAEAYSSMIRGAAHLEQKKWEDCLRSYATTRVVYTALSDTTKPDVFKNILAETIDPSLRYAAYQLKLPRTVEIQTIARRAFPKNDAALIERVNEVDPRALKLEVTAEGKEAEVKTISWRDRDVILEDLSVVTAWAKVEAAKAKLAETLSASWAELLPKDKAAAYEELLILSQDAVDATKTAIDELRAESVVQSDKRMQSLLIARTAMSYEMVSWRIGRNRVLSGDHDGATMDSAPDTKRKQKKATEEHKPRDESPSKQIIRLKKKVALYNSTLQSLETIKELSGLAQDQALSTRLDATYKYFSTLKCLAVARSHSITGNPVNALALTKNAFGQSNDFVVVLEGEATTPPSIEVGTEDATFLKTLLKGELQRCRALVQLEQLTRAITDGKPLGSPLADKLHEYPSKVDLYNIIPYPPKLEPIPIKPLFFDAAWNYIDYPHKVQVEENTRAPEKKPVESKQQPQKKGWFGFGR